MLPNKKPTPTNPSPVGAAKLDETDDKKSPVIPIWGTTGKDKLTGMPMFRSPGFAGKGTLIQRFKNLKTKDLAFITAGLAVLIMAPLAEYLISSPDDQSGTLKQGFDQKGNPLFPDGASPYEDGVAGIAPGGLMGQDSDVITPLNVRDPSSLIMSPGGQKKAEAPVATPTPSIATKPNDGWKDAIAAAKRGATTAVTKAKGLPRPSAKMAAGLKDWRSNLAGGSGASLKLDAPSSKGLFSSPKAGSSLARGPGYGGSSGARGLAAGGSGGGMYGGGRYGPGGYGSGVFADTFGPGGYPGGGTGSGYGSPGNDSPFKSPGGNSNKDNRSLGESLAFLRAKMEMEKAIDLKWAKRKYDELERKKMLEQMAAQTAQQALLKILDKLLEKPKDGGGDKGGGGGGPSGGGGGKDPGAGGAQPGTDQGAPGRIGRPSAVAANPGGSGQGLVRDVNAQMSLARVFQQAGTDVSMMRPGDPSNEPPNYNANTINAALQTPKAEVERIRALDMAPIDRLIGEGKGVTKFEEAVPAKPTDTEIPAQLPARGTMAAVPNTVFKGAVDKAFTDAAAALDKSKAYHAAILGGADAIQPLSAKAKTDGEAVVAKKTALVPTFENGPLKTAQTVLDEQRSQWEGTDAAYRTSVVIPAAQAAITTYQGAATPLVTEVTALNTTITASQTAANTGVQQTQQQLEAGYNAFNVAMGNFNTSLADLNRQITQMKSVNLYTGAGGAPDTTFKAMVDRGATAVTALTAYQGKIAESGTTFVEAQGKLLGAGSGIRQVYTGQAAAGGAPAGGAPAGSPIPT